MCYWFVVVNAQKGKLANYEKKNAVNVKCGFNKHKGTPTNVTITITTTTAATTSINNATTTTTTTSNDDDNDDGGGGVDDDNYNHNNGHLFIDEAYSINKS